MTNSRLFGTDGIRGVANLPPLTAETVLEVGRALAYLHRDRGKRTRIVIGRDTRRSGPLLEAALSAGICSLGVDVLKAGVIPTPGVAFLVRDPGAAAGVVISASHNPFPDNGIKIFSGDGRKLDDAAEDEIEALIGSPRLRNIHPTGGKVGSIKTAAGAAGRYLRFCRGTFPADLSLRGMKIVLDCSHGATSRIAPRLFRELGADLTVIHHSPSGVNINDHCGSQYPADLRKKVREAGAEIGLAFDGDGDRLIAVDEEGEVLTGDQILAICARLYRERGRLTPPLVISTVMSNIGLGLGLKKLGIRHRMSAVGDRAVLRMMEETGARLGGEDSGHLIFSDHHTTGDGIISALQLLSARLRLDEPLSRLARIVTVYPQKLLNIEVKEKPPLEKIPELRQAVLRAEDLLGERGRVLIRYSGTQRLCRVMVEGPTRELTDQLCSELAGLIRKRLG